MNSDHDRPASLYWGSRFFALPLLAFALATVMLFGQVTSIYAQDPPPFAREEVSDPVGLPSAQQGAALFEQNCAACHGPEGNSDGPVVPDLPAPPPKFSDPETIWSQSPAAYFHTTKFGRIENLMPPWGNRLSDDEIWQAAFYAWSLHTDEATVDAGRLLLESALADLDGAMDAQVNALFTETESLYRTQAELASELQTLLPDVDWSPTELARVLDYGRTLAYIPPWESAFRVGNGRIEGRVALVSLDGSTSQPDVSQVSVAIDAFAGRDLVATFDTPIDNEGKFVFTDLSTNSNITYFSQATYNDILYRGDAIQLSDSTPIAATLLSVYETTDDPSGLMISRLNWVVDNAPGEVVIGQIMTLGNQIAATYAGQNVDGADRPVTAEISIPPGAYDVQFQDGTLGESYVQVGDRFFDTTPITPGDETRQIFVSYRLAYDGVATEIEQTVFYPVNALNLLVADLPEMQDEVSVLEFAGRNTVQNVSYRLWQGTNVAPQAINIALSGLIAADGVDPRAEGLGADAGMGSGANAGTGAGSAGGSTLVTTTPPLDPMIPLALGGLLTIALAGLLIWPLRREQRTDPKVALTDERDELIREVAQLDDDHSAGKLREEYWSFKRAELKTRLLEVARELESIGGEGKGGRESESVGESESEGVGDGHE